jgi:hypothetical protein
MALTEFLRNLRIGALLRLPAHVGSDSRRIDANEMARRLAGAALWLTPGVVESFDLDDFPNLTPAQRLALNTYVNRFRTIANKLPPKAPVQEAALNEGLEALDGILSVLGPYIADPEGERVLVALTDLVLPHLVRGIYYESDLDSAGEETFDVCVVVADEAVNSPGFWDSVDEVRSRIELKLRELGVNKWIHVSFRTQSEHLDALMPSET